MKHERGSFISRHWIYYNQRQVYWTELVDREGSIDWEKRFALCLKKVESGFLCFCPELAGGLIGGGKWCWSFWLNSLMECFEIFWNIFLFLRSRREGSLGQKPICYTYQQQQQRYKRGGVNCKSRSGFERPRPELNRSSPIKKGLFVYFIEGRSPSRKY